MPTSNYDPLDDVPLSTRQSMAAQPSPSYSVITDSMTPEGPQQSHRHLKQCPSAPAWFSHLWPLSKDRVFSAKIRGFGHMNVGAASPKGSGLADFFLLLDRPRIAPFGHSDPFS